MGRIAVTQPTGDDVEKWAQIPLMVGRALLGRQAAKTAVSAGAKTGAKTGAKRGVLSRGVQAAKDDPLMAASMVQGAQTGHAANAQAAKQASQQQTMEAAQRGREISTGTAKSEDQYYYGDWVLEGPMHHAWTILKARMEVGPHDEQQDELFEHLKNLNPQHSIRTNEDDNSFILDNIHDQDEDIARRLIESYDRSFDETDPVVPQPESDYF